MYNMINVNTSLEKLYIKQTYLDIHDVKKIMAFCKTHHNQKLQIYSSFNVQNSKFSDPSLSEILTLYL